MGNGICNQEVRKHFGTKQDTKSYGNKGEIGDRSDNLVKLIGAERVSRGNYKYEGTYYVTEDGEVVDKKHANIRRAQRAIASFYEITDWEYDEEKQLYRPVIRRIVITKKTNIQLTLDL